MGYLTDKTAASLHSGTVGILHGSRIGVLQDKDGQITEPYSISAGLDYPGVGPAHCNLYKTKRAEVFSVNDDEAISAAFELTRLEGIIPALESAHILGALPKMKFSKDQIVVLTVSGRGDKDIFQVSAYLEKAGFMKGGRIVPGMLEALRTRIAAAK